jgi:beta-glucosidase
VGPPQPRFIWGVATSAFQIEGATRADGRGESIWDRFCLRPGAISDGSDARDACDHYHRVDADLDLLSELGVDAYRFSIAWPRLYPDGDERLNHHGLDFYSRLVDGLLARGIEAHLTLYHWDLPQALQDQGGWHSRAMLGRFASFAAMVARCLGDRLESIATLNEPWVVATLGHERGAFAPGIRSRAHATQVAHHLLVAHGMGLDAIRAENPGLRAGIVLNLSPCHPARADCASMVAAARTEDGLLNRWYLDALLRGNYPPDVLANLGADAPRTLPGDAAQIRRPMDFLGINYYTRSVAGDDPTRTCERTAMGWEIYPDGLCETLLRVSREYAPPPMYVMENGCALADQFRSGRIEDGARIDFLRDHVAAVHRARRGGADVRGYFAWSLLDNFEWSWGLSQRFGLYHVDFRTFERTAKDSAIWYREMIAAQRFGPG